MIRFHNRLPNINYSDARTPSYRQLIKLHRIDISPSKTIRISAIDSRQSIALSSIEPLSLIADQCLSPNFRSRLRKYPNKCFLSNLDPLNPKRRISALSTHLAWLSLTVPHMLPETHTICYVSMVDH